jgi:hypothetical protein
MAIRTTSNNNSILAGAKKTQVLRLIMKSVIAGGCLLFPVACS